MLLNLTCIVLLLLITQILMDLLLDCSVHIHTLMLLITQLLTNLLLDCSITLFYCIRNLLHTTPTAATAYVLPILIFWAVL